MIIQAKSIVSFVVSSLVLFASCSQGQNTSVKTADTSETSKIMNEKIQKTDDEWKNILSSDQFYVLRQKGTERPYSGKFEHFDEKGSYVCAACGNQLFNSDTKFDAGCGWPSFFDVIDKTKIITQVDSSHGMRRTEVMCAKCGGHLGHVFDDGPKPTQLRYCINSVSLDFKK